MFAIQDRFSPYYQFTDKPNGTYWCTSRIQSTSEGLYSVSVGTSFAHTKWFRGRDTTVRAQSRCPDPSCCRTPLPALAAQWDDRALLAPRLSSSLFATLPVGDFPGVDTTEAYDFLQRHAVG